MNIQVFLLKKINQALLEAGVPAKCKVKVQQSTKIQFGNYQVNGVMDIAKQLGLSSIKLASNIVKLLNLDGIACKIEIAGPGFINIFLDPHWLENNLTTVLLSPRLGISKYKPLTIVVDYSSPNIAKEMHVGHMRSTIIGDVSVRTLTFLGHNVIRANHIGDWGTQFGMLITYLEKIKDNFKIKLFNLDNFYLEAKHNYDSDPFFAKKARESVVKLQGGDKYYLQIWKKFVDLTIIQNQKIYDQLNVTLTIEDIMGESMYNKMLPNIVEDLKKKGIAVENEGAIIVFLNEFKNKKGKPMGVILQKKDGAYLYITNDIACAKYRYEKLKADRIIYYIDSRQHQHLMHTWTIVRKAGYVPEKISIEHHTLGMILGKDRKPFKTRAGGTVKLTKLLSEAILRAKRLIIAKNPFLNKENLNLLSRVIGIGSVKYADLSKNRIKDYIFDWDKMLNFEGNTAPYMQYAYTRIYSILKRSGQNKRQIKLNGIFNLKSEQEIQLAVRILQFKEAIIIVARNGTPHILCTYLYNLAVLFSLFYEKCPILNAENENLRQSRLKLAFITARTIKKGLELLGIETIERM